MKQSDTNIIPDTAVKREQMNKIVARLESTYPAATCSLSYSGEAWKLLVMGRLSAQCTDERVNTVCERLFVVCPSARAIADADIGELEEIMRPCGLFRTKAASIKAACAMICNEYDGVLPDSMEELLRFPGVGRKIANLLLGDIYHKPAIVTDTHCIRICGRLGMYDSALRDPAKIEKILADIIEPEKQSDFCHRLVLFGREYCSARSPVCEKNGKNEKPCPLADICVYANQKQD